jgi:multidrug efflux system outer membrane protein
MYVGATIESVLPVDSANGLDPIGEPPVFVVPTGLPSALLLRRPDLAEAEQRLIAANARVGLARAAYFPVISLTGFYGSESALLSDLFTGPAGTWRAAAALTQPILGFGRASTQVDAANARQRQALAQYQHAIQSAFRDVRDAIVAQTKTREQFDAEDRRVAALAESLRLARLRYENGITSQLEVLDAERNLLTARLNRSDALRAQRAAIANLFKSLGGGWASKRIQN